MKGNLYVVALVLVLIGALNWGLVALNDSNAVTGLANAVGLKGSTWVYTVKTVYVLVAISALYVLYKDWPLTKQ